MMTKQERRALREIERALHASDPRLVLVMSGGSYQRDTLERRAMIVLVDLLAVTLIVAAAATGALVLILFSTLVTVAALSLHALRRRARLV